MISELRKFPDLRTPLFPEGSVTPRFYCTISVYITVSQLPDHFLSKSLYLIYGEQLGLVGFKYSFFYGTFTRTSTNNINSALMNSTFHSDA